MGPSINWRDASNYWASRVRRVKLTRGERALVFASLRRARYGVLGNDTVAARMACLARVFKLIEEKSE